MSTTNTDWKISTDIYDIVSNIDTLKKKYIGDENESTLAVGIFGFLSDTEAKKIQTAIIGTGELGNEMFPQRAKLDKNIITHAMYCGISGINATPAHMIINLAIREDQLDDLLAPSGSSSTDWYNNFVFDHNNPIYVGDYEFHLDYDIVLHRYNKDKTNLAENVNWVYNAYYDMSENNILSTITSPYLKQPYRINFNNYQYIFMQALVRQVTIETTEDTMITNSIVDNKTFTFSFSNQLAGFDVYCTDTYKSTTTRLTALLYGSAIDPGVTNYCWYLYMNDNTIRIIFDRNSYIPGLNTKIKVIAYTTTGAAGNFEYKSDLSNGFYIDFTSNYYKVDAYGKKDSVSDGKKIICYVNCATASTDGSNKKTTEELKALIPKMALSRGYITTETDLNGYFNLISTDINRLQLQKKVDNQLERIWYCYLLMKDANNNVIPTDTLPIKISLEDGIANGYIITDTSNATGGMTGKYVIPAGTTFKYVMSDSSQSNNYCTYVDPDDIPTIYSSNYYADKTYYYMIVHNIIINADPLYCSFYESLTNIDDYFEYEYINGNIDCGFIANANHFERTLLTNKNRYKFSFTMAQSISEDLGLVTSSIVNSNIVYTATKLKVFLVFYEDTTPYRYIEAQMTAYDSADYKSSWEVLFYTNNKLNSEDQMMLVDPTDTNNKYHLFEVGKTTSLYADVPSNCTAYIYIFAEFDTNYGRDKAAGIIPDVNSGYWDLTNWSLVNIYKLEDGITFFKDYTDVMYSRVRVNVSDDKTKTAYDITGVPMVGYHYFQNEDNATYFVDQMKIKKAYIDYCLTVLENNMNVDFKFFNTYGYSWTYTVGDKEGNSLGNIDTSWNFRLQLTNSNDSSTKDSIINYIKSYIEDLNDSGNLHVTNLLHDIKDEYGDLINYIEYMNFNGNTRLGLNHIMLRDDIVATTVPEFINIRNTLSTDGSSLVPDITIEIVY